MYTIQHMHGNAIMCDMFLTIDISHLESFNTTTLIPTLLNYPGGNEEIALSVGLTLGVVGTTVVAVTVCCIWYACHRRRYVCHRRRYACRRRRYATQVAQLHYPTKTLLLVFPKFYRNYSNAWFLHLSGGFYYGFTVA